MSSLSSFQPVHTLREHEHFIQALAFSPKAISLALTATSGGAAEEGDEATPPPPPGAEEEAAAAAGGGGGGAGGGDKALYLASGGRDSCICVWNLSTGLLDFVIRDHANWVNDLVFHPSGKYLISASDDRWVGGWLGGCRSCRCSCCRCPCCCCRPRPLRCCS